MSVAVSADGNTAIVGGNEDNKPDIFNTDQGSQSTGQAFTSVLVKNDIAISMDGKGAGRDNVFVERLWRSVKYEEEVYLRAYDSVSDLRSAVTWTFTTVGAHTRVLTARHPIKPTSRRCLSAWQPNLGRRSTYDAEILFRQAGPPLMPIG